LAVTALSDAAFDAATAIAPGLRAAVDPAGAQLHLLERLVEELKLVFLPANRVLLAVDALLTTSKGRRDYDTYVADFSRLASRVADLPALSLGVCACHRERSGEVCTTCCCGEQLRLPSAPLAS